MNEHDLRIVNNALASLGLEPITSFDDGSDKSSTMKTRYPTIRNRVQSERAWNFARRQARLELARESTSDAPWRYYYRRPRDMATYGPTVVVRHNDTPPYGNVDFDLLDGFIVCNEANADAVYSASLDASQFPDYFVDLLALIVAESTGFALTDDAGLVRDLRLRLYGTGRGGMGVWDKAVLADDANRPPAMFRSSGVHVARLGGRFGIYGRGRY